VAPPAEILRPGRLPHVHGPLCEYGEALALMQRLVERPADADDVLLSVQHPPTITVGRRGARGAIHRQELVGDDGQMVTVPVHEIARGGSVTFHTPGQLVIYPIVRISRLAPPLGGGTLGDLHAFARALERAMGQCCEHFGLSTCTREGFAGLWIDASTKIGSLGVGIRRGWTFHGLALNVCPRLQDFELITPCGLDGVRMTSLHEELRKAGRPLPEPAEVEAELVARLQAVLVRSADVGADDTGAAAAQD